MPFRIEHLAHVMDAIVAHEPSSQDVSSQRSKAASSRGFGIRCTARNAEELLANEALKPASGMHQILPIFFWEGSMAIGFEKTSPPLAPDLGPSLCGIEVPHVWSRVAHATTTRWGD